MVIRITSIEQLMKEAKDDDSLTDTLDDSLCQAITEYFDDEYGM